MTTMQMLAVDELLCETLPRNTLIAHHGDCIGADADFHQLARVGGMRVIGHPPIKDVKRAFTVCDELREPKDYLVRNRDIVNESDYMIFTPQEDDEVLRSGTWSTARYAYAQGKPGTIVFPDGRMEDVQGFFDKQKLRGSD